MRTKLLLGFCVFVLVALLIVPLPQNDDPLIDPVMEDCYGLFPCRLATGRGNAANTPGSGNAFPIAAPGYPHNR